MTYGSSTWTFSGAEERTWWSALWAERCISSSFAEQAVAYGIATTAELEAIAAGWRTWAEDSDALFIAVHGEVLARR